MNSFTVGGNYGGSCIRVEENGPIMLFESMMYAVRVSNELPHETQSI